MIYAFKSQAVFGHLKPEGFFFDKPETTIKIYLKTICYIKWSVSPLFRHIIFWAVIRSNLRILYFRMILRKSEMILK